MTRVSAGVDRAPVFADADLDTRFRAHGFITRPLIPPDHLDRVRQAIEPLIPEDGGPFFSLYRNDGPCLRRRLDAEVRRLVEPLVDQLLCKHRTYIASALVKFPGTDTYLAPHQDWSFVDETRFVSGVVWVALEDVDEFNGGLFVVAGSHRLDLPFRGTPAARSIDDIVSPDLLSPVDVRAGHAVVYHNALIHGSAENRSDRARTALALGFVSEDAEMLHFHVDETGHRWRYRVADEHSFNHQPPDAPAGPAVLAAERWDSRRYALDARLLEELPRIAPVDGMPGPFTER